MGNNRRLVASLVGFTLLVAARLLTVFAVTALLFVAVVAKVTLVMSTSRAGPSAL